METEPVALEVFLKRALNYPRIQKELAGINVSPDKIEELILSHFLSMGIIMVGPMEFQKLILDEMVTFIRNSKDIRNLHEHAKRHAQSMRQVRHAK